MEEETEEVLAMAEESIGVLDAIITKGEDPDAEFDTHEVDAITEIHNSALKLKE